MVAHAKGEILYETQTKPILATPERVSNVKQPYKMDNNDNDMSPPPASDYLDQKQQIYSTDITNFKLGTQKLSETENNNSRSQYRSQMGVNTAQEESSIYIEDSQPVMSRENISFNNTKTNIPHLSYASSH